MIKKIKNKISIILTLGLSIMASSTFAYSNFSANADLVRVAPYGADAAVGGDNWSAGAAIRNFLNLGHKYRIRQNGTIKQVRFYAGANALAPNLTEFRIRIWRKNGGTYDMVGESEDLLPTMVPGSISTHVLASPIVGVQEGDYIGYKMIGTGNSSMYAVVGGTSNGTTSKYETGADVGASYNFDAAPGSLSNVALPIEIYMQAPQASFIGDSIIAGHPGHYSFLEGTLTTNIDSTIEKQFSNLTGYTYQNMGIGSQTTNLTSARFVTDVIDKKPRLAILEGGVNDIAGGTITKAQFIANNTAMLNNMQVAGTTALMVKILPWTGGSDAQLAMRDDWNTDLETLVDTYPNAFIVDAGPYIGQFNANGPVGNTWDIQPAYDVGGVHFNQAGHAKIAEAIADVLKPAASFDNDFAATEGNEINVNYNLFQIGDASTQNISQTATSGIEYSTDGGVSWNDASDAGGTSDGLIALSGSQAGTDHKFVWDAKIDLGIGTFNNILLRIRPSDGTSDAVKWVNSNPFNIIVISDSDIILAEIGADDNANSSDVTIAELNSILPVLTNLVAANETAYQTYIADPTNTFDAPATQAQVQAMINAVNAAEINSNIPKGKSGKSHSGKSSKKVCKDSKAINFNNVGQHDQSLCKYKEVEEKTETKTENNSKLGEGAKCSASQILTQNMKAGDRNGKYSSWERGTINEVKLLQAHMNRLGFNSGAVDGILGPMTDGAIKRMQKALGFSEKLIDGYVGPLTRERINNSCEWVK